MAIIRQRGCRSHRPSSYRNRLRYSLHHRLRNRLRSSLRSNSHLLFPIMLWSRNIAQTASQKTRMITLNVVPSPALTGSAIGVIKI